MHIIKKLNRFCAKRKFLRILIVVFISLFLLIGFSAVFPEQDIKCQSYKEASLAGKIIRGFGLGSIFAAAPDPDICGSDSIGCNGSNPTARISWLAAPSSFFSISLGKNCTLRNYDVYLEGNLIAQTSNLFYDITSGLAPGTLYNWSIDAKYNCIFGPLRKFSNLGGYNLPSGSFITSNCAPSPVADIKANGSDGPISVDFNASVNISWTSSDTTSCSVSPSGWSGTSGSQQTPPLLTDITYILDCVGPGGRATDSVTVNVSFPFPFWQEVSPF